MTSRNRVLGLLGVVLAVALAGCGSPALPPVPPAPSSAAPSSRLPARPVELRMDGVDPCALLTDAQRTQLDASRGSQGRADEFGSLDCQWDNYGGPPDNGWLARLILKQPADYALDSLEPTQVVQVDGFAAVQTSAGGQDPKTHCLVLVDVAQGQTLWTQYVNLRGDYPKITHEVACKLTRDFAAMAVATLKTLAK